MSAVRCACWSGPSDRKRIGCRRLCNGPRKWVAKGQRIRNERAETSTFVTKSWQAVVVLRPRRRQRSAVTRSRSLRRMNRSRPGGFVRDWSWLTAGVTSLSAVAALVFTGLSLQQGRQQLEVSQQGQLTDRYSQAVEHIGSPSLDVRIGGIYALERLSIDSPRDLRTIREVLAAFIRDHGRQSTTNYSARDRKRPGFAGRPTDVEAVLSVLGRLPRGEGKRIDVSYADLAGVRLSKKNLLDLDLSDSDFSGADLGEATFTGSVLASANFTNSRLADAILTSSDFYNANFSGADLRNADFRGASLVRAHFRKVNLTEVRFTGAVLANADLTRTNFEGSDLTGINLSYSDLTDANLRGADLTGADMDGAILKNADLTGARLDNTGLSGVDLSHANLTHVTLK